MKNTFTALDFVDDLEDAAKMTPEENRRNEEIMREKLRSAEMVEWGRKNGIECPEFWSDGFVAALADLPCGMTESHRQGYEEGLYLRQNRKFSWETAKFPN